MKILGIETSCDETGVAIVKDGQKILSNVISSSVSLHQKFGGVVPEVAAREQVKVIIPVIQEALDEARLIFQKIDAIAVTAGPGLVGSLLVGVETAKTLAVVFKKPLVPVNHLIGHIYANFISEIPNSKFQIPNFPAIALIVSGGHTDLVLMTDHEKFKWLGGTRDDAAGEAFDKVARILGLGYPGGPEIERVAKNGNPVAYNFPRPMIDSPDFDFSFSGLKTAAVNLLKTMDYEPATMNQASDIATSFQAAIVDVLVGKTIKAAKQYKTWEILLGGGVAANLELRNQILAVSKPLGIDVKYPSVELCIDNGAMVASAAFYNFKPVPFEKIQAQPGLYF